MSGWAAALALAIRFGDASGPDLTVILREWQVEYQGLPDYEGYVVAGDWKLEFTPRPYRRWRIRHNRNNGPQGEWSPWFPADPSFPGDVTGDCSVGGADLNVIGQNWARSCP